MGRVARPTARDRQRCAPWHRQPGRSASTRGLKPPPHVDVAAAENDADARAGDGLDAALKRLEAYDRAGADILFLEAPHSEDEMRTACSHFAKPMMANMADGGKTPILPVARLKELGFAFAIYPSMTSLVGAHAMELALRRLKDTGVSQSPEQPMFDFIEFCKLIGFQEVWDFEERWAKK